MVRRVTPSQFRSLLRQTEQKVRQIQRKQKQAVNQYNREVQRHNQKIQQEVNRYNRDVRTYNARVRAHQQRLASEIARLKGRSTPPAYEKFRLSVDAVQTAYRSIEHRAEAGAYDDRFSEILDLSEREAANNASVMNVLLGDFATETSGLPLDESDKTVIAFLQTLSNDLTDRWKGALFSLNPGNPDAARHFCTSAREVITQILEQAAPDAAVISDIPSCDLTPRGKPTRRVKIRFCLRRKGLDDENLEEFVEEDMRNVIELFDIFNAGTHGSAGRYDPGQLRSIKQRVEDGIAFLSSIVG